MRIASAVLLGFLTFTVSCESPEAPEVQNSAFLDSDFALIPAGAFLMGAKNGDSNERPRHLVTLTRPFYMQKTEVTQRQWRWVMGSNPSSFSGCGDDCPVETVSWVDVQVFLGRLNASDPGKNFRLPTEAEWEYAARAGTTRDYGGTGVMDDMGWYIENSEGMTHLVGQKRANGWGLYDMHGNVWEWVQDWYSSTYYGSSPRSNPFGPSGGEYLVVRGGSWRFIASNARSANRNFHFPRVRGRQIGFRLARTR